MTETVITQDPLTLAIHEYKTAPLTPELVDGTWKTMWTYLGEELGEHQFAVPSCDRSSLELEELRVQGREVLLVPDEIMTPEGLVFLGKVIPHRYAPNGILWPEYAIREIQNGDSRGGAIDVEMTNRPNPNLTSAELKKLLEEQGRAGQRFATYVIGSFFSRLLSGKYFDPEWTYTRLVGSSYKGHVMGASSAVDGTVVVFPNFDDSETTKPLPHLNGRSEGRKQA